MEEEKRGRGRPKKPDAKRNDFHVRLTDDELNQLKYVCDAEGKTISEVIINGIHSQYNLTKYRNS